MKFDETLRSSRRQLRQDPSTGATAVQRRLGRPGAVSSSTKLAKAARLDRPCRRNGGETCAPVRRPSKPWHSRPIHSDPLRPGTNFNTREAVEKVRRVERTLLESAAATSSRVVRRQTTATHARAREDKKQPSRTWAAIIEELQRKQAVNVAASSRTKISVEPVRTSGA